MEQTNHGELRFIRELDARLNAVITKHYQDKSLGEYEDNATRMRATELLAGLLGKLKSDVNLHTDTIEIIPPPKPEDLPPDES